MKLNYQVENMIDGLFLLLGSNADGSVSFLEKAHVALSSILGNSIGVSSVFKTEPWGITDQNWFLNQVVVYDIPDIGPPQLLITLKELEKDLGRKKTIRWGPREIDIDILYWGETIFDSESLNIPHPSLHERRFTLTPLVEIAPYKLHPIFNKTQKELLEICEDNSMVELAHA